MIISINDATPATTIVSVALALAIIFSVRSFKKTSLFPIEVSNELKGLAVLMVVLSHIGYFLVSDNRFLVPLSNYAGVGVDLFIILSGCGLVISAIEKPLSILQFYRRRLLRIYTPIITSLAILLAADYVFLHRTYPLKLTLLNFFGIFPEANLYTNIDSPLWYITFLLIMYLIFPIFFRRRFPFLSSIATGIAAWFIILLLPKQTLLPLDRISFYKLHFLSFPVGMALGAFISKYGKSVFEFFSSRRFQKYALGLITVIFSAWVLYTTFHNSHVGEIWYKESLTSIYSSLAIIAIFIFKPFKIKYLELYGVYSFEIYMLHWPLVWRYNFLYGKIPTGFATILYLLVFLIAGYLLQKLVKSTTKLLEADVLRRSI